MTPYDEGFKACQRGEPFTANPHRPGSPAWREWSVGWTDLDEHIKVRDEALASIGWFG